MSIREYEIDGSSNIEELRHRLSEAFFQKHRLEVTGSLKADDLSIRRGTTEKRTFVLLIVLIDYVTSELQALVQDTETSEWATLTITGASATIMVVS